MEPIELEVSDRNGEWLRTELYYSTEELLKDWPYAISFGSYWSVWSGSKS